MMSILVIALGLSVAPSSAPMVRTHTQTVQALNGDYTVTYANQKSTHAPKRNAAAFKADEGNNGAMPLSIAKHL